MKARLYESVQEVDLNNSISNNHCNMYELSFNVELELKSQRHIHAHRVSYEELQEDIKTAKEEVLQSLNIIMKQKEASVNAENLEKDDAGNLLIKSRSIKDVLIYYPEFKRYEQQTIVVCDLCVDKS